MTAKLDDLSLKLNRGNMNNTERLAARRQTGRDADRLAGIVDRYLPDVPQETRSYMIRFPHEIKGLLTKARRIRRKMKARAGRSAPAGHKGKTRKASTRMQSGGRTEDARKTPQPTARDAAAIPTQAEEDDGQLEEVDLGSAEAASTTPDKDTESAESERPEKARAGRTSRASHAGKTRRASTKPKAKVEQLLQKMPQPQQPQLKKTMANSTKWTGGVQSLPASRQTKTRSPPKAQAVMGESSAERTLRSPSPGRAAEGRRAYQWFYVPIWGRRDHEHPAGV